MGRGRFVGEQVLSVLFYQWLQVPKPLGQRAMHALMRSTYSRPKAFVAGMVLACTPFERPSIWPMNRGKMARSQFDLNALFREKFTPTYMMGLFEDLVLEGLLTRQEASAVEQYLLHQVTANGEWWH